MILSLKKSPQPKSAPLKNPNSHFYTQHPLIHLHDQGFRLLRSRIKNHLKLSLLSTYYRNLQDRLQITDFDSLNQPLPLPSITTKSPQTLKTGRTFAFFSDFHSFNRSPQTLKPFNISSQLHI